MTHTTHLVESLMIAARTAPAPRDGLQWIDFLALGIYLLVTMGIVIWSSRREASTGEFFLGGRRMPWMAVGLSVLATLMSSISYMGVPGEMIKNGVAMFAQYLALPLSMTVVLFVWVPFFMRLRFTSAYEYLERRFDVQTRIIGSLLFLMLRLGWMSMVTYVGSLALSQMVGTLIPADTVDPIARWFDPSAAEPAMMRALISAASSAMASSREPSSSLSQCLVAARAIGPPFARRSASVCAVVTSSDSVTRCVASPR